MKTFPEISEIIDPEGDVVLVLDRTELQVSSKVLGLASPVFKAMFSPSFSEGKELQTTGTLRITLPEDNAGAMTTLCNILHHRPHGVAKEPSHQALVELAILCDKYACGEKLEPWSRTWLSSFQQAQSWDTQNKHSLLFPFYVFNDAEAFKQVSIMMVYHSKGFIDKPEMMGSLPDGVVGESPSGVERQGPETDVKI